MEHREPLPDGLPEDFPVWLARAHGVTRGRLRQRDLDAPFFGARLRRHEAADIDADDPYAHQRLLRVERARQYAPRLHTGHYFSHQTAAAVWEAPLPLEFTPHGEVAGAADLELHVSAFGHIPFPRATGVRGHRTMLRLTEVTEHDGLRVSSPAATWASLGVLPLFDLVALGDFFCRRWREGRGRPHAGRPPLSTIEDLRRMLGAGRRRGADRLRAALGMIREDAWSPRESLVRCMLVEARLPEPELNTDVYDERGMFLGCVDLAYPREKVAIEYLGMLHGERWAQDVERLARLRAAGWAVIEVTSPLLKRPHDLVARVTAALKV
jgi:very-short-patch-repair endonuclease